MAQIHKLKRFLRARVICLEAPTTLKLRGNHYLNTCVINSWPLWWEAMFANLLVIEQCRRRSPFYSNTPRTKDWESSTTWEGQQLYLGIQDAIPPRICSLLYPLVLWDSSEKKGPIFISILYITVLFYSHSITPGIRQSTIWYKGT